MNTKRNLLRIKNRILGTIWPHGVGRKEARQFLTPRRLPVNVREKEAEACCERIAFGSGFSAARWGNGGKRILAMHGWESRATQMYGLVPDLIAQGFEVIGLDGPAHGHSRGELAHPVAFARAIGEADSALGPFYGAIGHSMGGASIAVAMEAGVRFRRVVLISSPNSLYVVLKGYAHAVGMPPQVTLAFIEAVGREVGRPAKTLDVGKIFAALNPEALIMHAMNDVEVPFACCEAIIRDCPGLHRWQSDSLGHRKIVRSPEVSRLVSRFMCNGQA